jgi:hypothetical protein
MECPVVLDTTPTIFCCLNTSERDFAVSKGRVIGMRTGRTVSILHANGGKHNLDILQRHWAFVRGTSGAWSDYDLRIPSVDGHPLTYDAERKKFLISDRTDQSTVVSLVKGNGQAIFFTAATGLLTFVPGGTVNCDATKVSIWETFKIRPIETADHGLAIVSYHNEALNISCDPVSDRPIVLDYMTLAYLLHPFFVTVIDIARQYHTSF